MCYIEAARPHVQSFIQTIADPDSEWGHWRYHSQMERPWGLISSAQVIRILHLLDLIDEITETDRQSAIELLQSTQDPADGYFKDPLVTEAEHQGKHSWEDIWGQMGSAGEALKLLGSKPVHAMPEAAFADLSEVEPEAFLDSLGWENPWHVGERASRCLRAYINKHPEALADPQDCDVLNRAYSFLIEQIFDPTTGYPTKRGCEIPHVAMAGAFKTSMCWLAAGVPFPYPEAVIDSTLSYQLDSGAFFDDPTNMCINWDSAWLLHEMDIQLQQSYRHQDITDAYCRLADYLNRTHLKPDGGYSFFRDHCTPNHHSVRLSKQTYPIGDTIGTVMALNCLIYADEATSNRPMPKYGSRHPNNR